jgi:hypothetical protein
LAVATKAKAVPWEEVVDVCDDLFDWLVAKGLADGTHPHVTAAVRILTSSPDDLVAAVAQALVRVELYRSADQLNDARTRFGPRLPQEIHELLFDYSTEQGAEHNVRALSSRLAEIRRLIVKIEERKVRRAALYAAGPRSDADGEHQQAKLDNVLASLRAVGEAAQSLLESFREFSPGTTEYPLTFAGWKQFEKAIRAELAKLGFVWPS